MRSLVVGSLETCKGGWELRGSLNPGVPQAVHTHVLGDHGPGPESDVPLDKNTVHRHHSPGVMGWLLGPSGKKMRGART